MDRAKPDALFMHSLPARRGEEVVAPVIDGRRSVVWSQAANRVPAQQAAIHTLLAARRAARGA
jgi:ornithine carbamoyltransferase